MASHSYHHFCGESGQGGRRDAQSLKALTGLAEDLALVPTTHMETQLSVWFGALFWPPRALHTNAALPYLQEKHLFT